MLGVSLEMGFVAAAVTQGLVRGAICLGVRRILFCLIGLLVVGSLLSHQGAGRIHKPSRFALPVLRSPSPDRKVAHEPLLLRRAYHPSS